METSAFSNVLFIWCAMYTVHAVTTLINIFTEMDFDLLFFKSRNAIKSITAEMDTS